MFFLNENEDYTNILNEEEITGVYDGVEGALELVLETEDMLNNLKDRMVALEFDAVMNENEVLVKEGKKSFFASFKGIIDRMIKGIVAMFKNFLDWITKLAGSDQKLAEKFKDNNTVVEIKAFEFQGLQKYADGLGKVKSIDFASFTNYEPTLAYKEMCGILGLTGDCATSTSEFKKASMDFIRGGKEAKKVNIVISRAAKFLETYKEDIKQAKTGKDELVAYLNKVRNDMMKLTKDEAETKDDKLQGATIITLAKQLANLSTIAYGCLINGLKERRGMARQAIRAEKPAKAEEKTEKEVKNESADFITGILAQF